MTADDAYRLVLAATPLITANFDLNKEAIKAVQRRRPRLTRCVRNAVAKVRIRNAPHPGRGVFRDNGAGKQRESFWAEEEGEV